MSRNIPWPRVFAEGIAIVTSILLAFGIQAWWDANGLRREVAADLSGIDHELESNLQLMEFELDLLSRVVAAGQSLLTTLEGQRHAPFVVVVDTIAQMARGPSPTLDVSLGGIEALLASGRLAAVRSAELRRRLAGLVSMIDEVTEDEAVGRQVGWQQLSPAVYSRADLNLGHITQRLIADRVPAVPLHSRGTVDHPNHPEIRSALRTRTGWYTSAILDARKLRDEMVAIRTLIAQELTASD